MTPDDEDEFQMDYENLRSKSEIREAFLIAKKHISKPENWCQDNFAQDAKGNACGPEKAQAVAWCSVGILMKIAKEREIAYKALSIHLKLRIGHIGFFNDAKDKNLSKEENHLQKHAEVVQAFSDVIARLS